MEWRQHLVTMNDGRTAKELPEGKPGEGSKQERPRLRWLNDVESDLMNMCARIWKTGTVGGTEWASLVTDAMVELKGL